MDKIKRFFISNWMRIVAFTLILIFMLGSMTVMAKKFTDPQTYSKTIQSIDEKKLTVLGVSASLAGISTALSSVPGDAASPLAEELMDLSSCLVLVICVLVLEKSLLTVFGSASCYVLFPIACIFALVFLFKRKQIFAAWAIKFAVLGLALLTIVPAAMRISDYIYEVNQVTIEQNVDFDTEDTTAETDANPDEDLPWYNKLWNSVTGAVKDAADAITDMGEKAIEEGKKALSNFTDAVTVFIIAYCAIPVFVVFLFLWLLKILFGINVEIDYSKFSRKKLKEKKKEENHDLALIE